MINPPQTWKLKQVTRLRTLKEHKRKMKCWGQRSQYFHIACFYNYWWQGVEQLTNFTVRFNTSYETNEPNNTYIAWTATSELKGSDVLLEQLHPYRWHIMVFFMIKFSQSVTYCSLAFFSSPLTSNPLIYTYPLSSPLNPPPSSPTLFYSSLLSSPPPVSLFSAILSSSTLSSLTLLFLLPFLHSLSSISSPLSPIFLLSPSSPLLLSCSSPLSSLYLLSSSQRDGAEGHPNAG